MMKFATNAQGGYMAFPELSNTIRFAALPMYRFRNLCSAETQFHKNHSDILYFNKVGELTSTGRVVGELETVPETSYTITQDNMRIHEYTNSVPWTEWLEDMATLDVGSVTYELLLNDYQRTLESAAAIQFLSADIIYTPLGTKVSPTHTVVTNGTVVANATRNILAFDIRNIIDYMRSTYKMPTYTGNEYLCVASTTFLRGLREDPDFVDALLYGRPESLFTGEIGMYYGCRFLEENNLLSNSYSGGLGEAVFIAADAVKEIEIQPVEIQSKIAQDYGRDKAIRWVWKGGFKSMWSYATDTQARLIKVASAS